MSGVKRRPVAERFWLKVARGPGCWEWTGALNWKGYGLQKFNGLHERLAHRIAWVLTNGEIANGLCALHKCDNPKCVNPDHLFLGTTQDNIADKMAKGRARGGVPKLTDDQVIEILNTPKVRGSGAALAKRLGVTRGHVAYIRNGKRRRAYHSMTTIQP